MIALSSVIALELLLLALATAPYIFGGIDDYLFLALAGPAYGLYIGIDTVYLALFAYAFWLGHLPLLLLALAGTAVGPHRWRRLSAVIGKWILAIHVGLALAGAAAFLTGLTAETRWPVLYCVQTLLLAAPSAAALWYLHRTPADRRETPVADHE